MIKAAITLCLLVASVASLEADEEYRTQLMLVVGGLSSGCQAVAQPEMQAKHSLPREEGCAWLTQDATKTQFTSESACTEAEYQSVKSLVCGESSSSSSDTKSGEDKEFEKKITEFVASLSENCQAMFQTNNQMSREQGCKLMGLAPTRIYFTTGSKCTDKEYDGIKALVCGEDGGSASGSKTTESPDPKTEYQEDLIKTVMTLSASCQGMAVESDLKVMSRDVACMELMKSNIKMEYTKEGGCSEGEYDHVKTMVCSGHTGSSSGSDSGRASSSGGSGTVTDEEFHKELEDAYASLSGSCRMVAKPILEKELENQSREDICTEMNREEIKETYTSLGCSETDFGAMKDVICGSSVISLSLVAILFAVVVHALKKV